MIDTDLANRIYDVLVSVCGANESDRDRFLHYITSPALSHEWRFIGSLGFGGKLYHNDNRIYIACYPEDETPERKRIISDANERLAAIYRYGQRGAQERI